jgi:hypothetical protein
MRAFGRLTDEEFEASLAAWRAEWERTGRKPSIERFITLRGDNTRLERETDANMARLDSTLRRIERDYEFDASQTGEQMRLFVAMTRQTWREWALSLSVNRGRPCCQQCPAYQFGHQRTLAYSDERNEDIAE